MGFEAASTTGDMIPPNWRREKLGKILPLEYGKALPARLREAGEVAVFGSAGIVGSHSETLVTAPAIIVGRKGSAGSVYFSPTPSWPIDTAYFAIGSADLDVKFGYHLLRHLRLERLDQSTAIPSLSRDVYSAIEVSFPSLDQQVRIVARIEELFGEIEAGEQELAAAKADLARYRRAVLKAAVTGELTRDWREQNPPKETGADLLARILKERRARWEAAELAKLRAKGQTPKNDAWKTRYPEPVAPNTADLPELPRGWVWASPAQLAADERHSLAIGPFGSNLKVSDYRAEGVPLVFVRHIRTKDFNGLSPKFASAEKADELSAHSVCPGDLLITKMGDPPGDAAVYPANLPRAIITADCIKLRPHVELLSEYFELAINSPLGGAAFSAITKGVAQQKVTLEAFSAIAVPLPSAIEQRTIVDIAKALLDAGSELCGNIDARITEATRLRQSILAAAFSGKLVAGEAPVSRRRAVG